MSADQDRRQEEDPSTGDSLGESPESQPPSEHSTTISRAATQGSHAAHSTPESPAESSCVGHLALTESAEDVAPDYVQDWLLEKRPAPEDATRAMEQTLARIMACYEGPGAAKEALDNDADTEQSPTPPSDG